ncbi:porin [Limnohabitans sp.]|jgi:predicted porin|uniref:porin n=1 Tax=Limnohabitans sp. TaxID=1907725 RepID=UPI0037BEE531
MKKTLIALATLAAATGAMAQSTVTLFGGADLNVRSVTSGTNKFSGMAQDGIYSSRFGVMGTEDLGGGLKAGFHFEGGMNPDVGTSAKFDFQRKSTIGLAGGFGEVRLGRDYTPLFTVAGIADPFGTNGVGSSYNLANAVVSSTATGATAGGTFRTAQAASKSGADAASTVLAGTAWADVNAVRANNSVAYYSPSFSGFTVSGMYSFGTENTNTDKDVGTMTSIKLAYANGPVSVAFANQVTKGGLTGAAAVAAAYALPASTGVCATGSAAGTGAFDGLCLVTATAAVQPTEDQKWTTNFLAGSYDLGVAKLSAGYKTDKTTEVTGTLKSTILGVTAPMGAATLKASYVARKLGSAKVGNQIALGALYDLSKRTTVYAAYSVLTNEAGYGMNVGSAAASDFTGVKSKGFEAGVKHSF